MEAAAMEAAAMEAAAMEVAAMWQRRVNGRADTPHHEVAADHFIRNSAFLPDAKSPHLGGHFFISRLYCFLQRSSVPPLSGRFSQARAGEGAIKCVQPAYSVCFDFPHWPARSTGQAFDHRSQ